MGNLLSEEPQSTVREQGHIQGTEAQQAQQPIDAKPFANGPETDPSHTQGSVANNDKFEAQCETVLACLASGQPCGGDDSSTTTEVHHSSAPRDRDTCPTSLLAAGPITASGTCSPAAVTQLPTDALVPPRLQSSTSAAIFMLLKLLRKAITTREDFPVPLPSLYEMMNTDKKAVKLLSSVGYGSGPKSCHPFEHFVQLALLYHHIHLSAYHLLETGSTVLLAKHPSPNAQHNSSLAEGTEVAARMLSRVKERLATGPCNAVVLQAFLCNPVDGGCPEDAATFYGAKRFQSRHPDVVEVDSLSQMPIVKLKHPLADRHQPSASECAPDDGLPPSTPTDDQNLREICRAFRDLVLAKAQPTIPAEILRKLLRKQIPGSKGTLKQFGYSLKGSAIEDFWQYAVRLFPSDLAGYEVGKPSAESDWRVRRLPLKFMLEEKDCHAAASESGIDQLRPLCRHMRNLLIGRKLPVESEALGAELRQACPNAKAVLRQHGYGLRKQKLCDFIRLTLQRMPELRAMEFVSDLKGGGIVCQRSATESLAPPTVTGAKPPTPAKPPAPAAATSVKPEARTTGSKKPAPAAATGVKSPLAASTSAKPPTPDATTSAKASAPDAATSTKPAAPTAAIGTSPPVSGAATSAKPPVPDAATSAKPPVPDAATSAKPPVPDAATSAKPPASAEATSAKPPALAEATSAKPPAPAAATRAKPPASDAATSATPPTPDNATCVATSTACPPLEDDIIEHPASMWAANDATLMFVAAAPDLEDCGAQGFGTGLTWEDIDINHHADVWAFEPELGPLELEELESPGLVPEPAISTSIPVPCSMSSATDFSLEDAEPGDLVAQSESPTPSLRPCSPTITPAATLNSSELISSISLDSPQPAIAEPPLSPPGTVVVDCPALQCGVLPGGHAAAGPTDPEARPSPETPSAHLPPADVEGGGDYEAAGLDRRAPQRRDAVAAPAARSLQLKLQLLAALKSAATFPAPLEALLQSVERQHPTFSQGLQQLGYAQGAPHQFRHFVHLTLLSFPRRLRGYHLVDRNGSAVVEKRCSMSPPFHSFPAPIPHCGPPPGADPTAPTPPNSDGGLPAVPLPARSPEPPSDPVGLGESLTGGKLETRASSSSPTAAPRVCWVADNDGLRAACQALRQYVASTLASDDPPGGHCIVLAFQTLHGRLHLVAATALRVYIFDVDRLVPRILGDALRPLLECPGLYKAMHDVRSDITSLLRLGVHPAPLLDTQLAHEHLTGDRQSTLSDVLRLCGASVAEDGAWKEEDRLPRNPSALALALPALVNRLGPDLNLITRASDLRVKLHGVLASPSEGASELLGFDVAHQCRPASYELLHTTRPKDVLPPAPSGVDHSGIQALLHLLPFPFQALALPLAKTVTAVVLDLGRRPEAFCGDRRVFLAEDEAVRVTMDHINGVVDAVGPDAFHSGNCAAVPDTLHHISAILSMKKEIIGLTIWVVRRALGLPFLLSDVLLGKPHHSVLFVGEQRSGKTTAIRDVACLLSQWQSVVAVDTQRDLGGAGPDPHPSLGKARRVTPPSLAGQALAMAEAVQRQRPAVLVVDELWDEAEARVARAARRRGVRLVAGLQGTLSQLVRDRRLAALIGGPGGPPAEPLFDCVVEVRESALGEWVVITDVSKAVDCILCGQPYPAVVRTRDPTTGMVRCTPLPR